ncbi:serine carboxypeptidase [Trifolium repens]|nr:serine carboxypeptidase [Trifolium repens]
MNLALKSHSWTKVSNIIFLDLPAGTGFSYPKTEAAVQQSTWKLVHNAHQFLRKWLIDHPKFISHEVYIAGDSYSGIPLPIIVQEISYGNDDGLQPWINLQGYILGNPLTTPKNDDYRIPFSHGMALISSLNMPPLSCRTHVYFLSSYWANDDNVRKALHIRKGSIGKWKRCNGDSFPYHVNLSRKGFCSLIYSGDHDMKVPFLATQAWIKSLNYSIVDDWRQWYYNDQVAGYTRTYSNRMTFATVKGPIAFKNEVYNGSLPNLVLRQHSWTKGSIGKWKRCNDIPFTHEIINSLPYHANLSRKGFRSLIYSGDHDMRIPFLATQAWIRSLNYSIVDDWIGGNGILMTK